MGRRYRSIGSWYTTGFSKRQRWRSTHTAWEILPGQKISYKALDNPNTSLFLWSGTNQYLHFFNTCKLIMMAIWSAIVMHF